MSMIVNPYWFAAGGGGSLDPGSYLAGLDWDLDADTISGNDGDAVVDWFDSSGAAKHYGQDTGASQPTLKKTLYNGHSAVRFATNDKLVADPNPAGFGSASTLIIVCTPSSTTNSYILGGSGSEGIPAIISGFASKAFEYYNTAGERQTFAASASGLHVLTLTRTDDSGNVIGYYDGTQVFSVAVNGSLDWTGLQITEIGNNGNAAGDNFYNGDVPRIIKFNQNHAGAAGLTNLHTAIKSFYGVT
jgi:hypothetical protein